MRLHHLAWEWGHITWPGNEAISVGVRMRLYQLEWEWGYISWSGNEAISVGVGMRLYQLAWEWSYISWTGNEPRLQYYSLGMRLYIALSNPYQSLKSNYCYFNTVLLNSAINIPLTNEQCVLLLTNDWVCGIWQLSVFFTPLRKIRFPLHMHVQGCLVKQQLWSNVSPLRLRLTLSWQLPN